MILVTTDSWVSQRSLSSLLLILAMTVPTPGSPRTPPLSLVSIFPSPPLWLGHNFASLLGGHKIEYRRQHDGEITLREISNRVTDAHDDRFLEGSDGGCARDLDELREKDKESLSTHTRAPRRGVCMTVLAGISNELGEVDVCHKVCFECQMALSRALLHAHLTCGAPSLSGIRKGVIVDVEIKVPHRDCHRNASFRRFLWHPDLRRNKTQTPAQAQTETETYTETQNKTQRHRDTETQRHRDTQPTYTVTDVMHVPRVGAPSVW